MTVKTFEVALTHMPVGRDVFEYTFKHEYTQGEFKTYKGVTPAYEFDPNKELTDFPLGQAAIDVVREYVGQEPGVHGTRVVYFNKNLNVYVMEVDMEFSEVRTGLPTSPFQTWLDEHDIDEERYEWANDIAIQLISGLGYTPEEKDATGYSQIEDEAQTLMIKAVLCLPKLANVASLVSDVRMFDRAVRGGRVTR